MQEDLSGAKANLEDTAQNLSKAESDLTATSEELQKALELAKRRQDVAQRIKDDFAKAGIIAEVDKSTGDVILDFGNDYFDTDSYKLKPGMLKTIRRAIPVYAKSLFDSDSETVRYFIGRDYWICLPDLCRQTGQSEFLIGNKSQSG